MSDKDEKLQKEYETVIKENAELRKKLSEFQGGGGESVSVPADTEAPDAEASEDEAPQAEASEEWGDVRLVDSDRYNEILIPEDYGILFCSMVNHILVLREQKSGGAEFIFTKFGEKKHIPYSIAKKIFEYNKFFENGVYAILTPEFLEKYGVQNQGANIGTMQRMIEGQIPADEFITRFRAMPESQRQEVADEMVRKLMKNKDAYQSFFLLKLQNELNLNLAERAESSRNLQKIYKEEAENGRIK